MNQTNELSFFAVNEVELIYRNKINPELKVQVSNSKSAYELLNLAWDENRIDLIEQFKILMLDYRNNVLGISDVATGGVSHCQVDFKILWATALKANASKIIAAHNHPSGFPFPSDADIKLTKKMVEAGKLLQLPLIDHMILTANDYYSFADSGLIP